jgi:cell division protein FtsL
MQTKRTLRKPGKFTRGEKLTVFIIILAIISGIIYLGLSALAFIYHFITN